MRSACPWFLHGYYSYSVGINITPVLCFTLNNKSLKVQHQYKSAHYLWNQSLKQFRKFTFHRVKWLTREFVQYISPLCTLTSIEVTSPLMPVTTSYMWCPASVRFTISCRRPRRIAGWPTKNKYGGLLLLFVFKNTVSYTHQGTLGWSEHIENSLISHNFKWLVYTEHW